MDRPCTDRPNTAVVHPSAGTGDGMSDGGRTSHVSGDSPAGLQENWPTTGGAVGAGVAAVAVVVGGAALVGAAVIVVEEAGNDVVDDVGAVVVVAAVVGVMLAVGTDVADPATDSFADDSTRVVHPAAANPTMSTASVTIDVR